MDRSVVATFLLERCERLHTEEDRLPWWALPQRWALHKRQREAMEALLDFFREYGVTEGLHPASGAPSAAPEPADPPEPASGAPEPAPVPGS